MKKQIILCAGLCAAMAFTSCKPGDSAYKQAYMKAKQQEEQQQQQQPAQEEPVVVAPVETKPANDTQVVDNTDNVNVRQENVTLISGSGLKAFSVVVGSFSLQANAEGLQQQLRNAGYDAQIVRNTQGGTFRVVATTFDTKGEAVASRNELQGKYHGAWLLYNK